MDYSSIENDPDHPAGGDPWASSPRQHRSSFATQPTSDIPPSPLPPQSPYGEDSQQEPQYSQGRPGSRADDSAGQHQSQHADNDQLQSPQSPNSAGQEQGKRDPQRYHATRPRPAGPQYKLQAKITGLERTGRKDPILKFDVYTNLPKFRTTQFRDVRRLHSEFEKLAEHLISANPEAFVPAVPPAVTSAGAGTDEDEARVKATLQRWLSTVCGNDVLMRDEEMVFFVESDFGYSPVVRRKQPATGVRRKVLKQFAPPPDDTPELADSRPIVKLFYLGTMDCGQKVDKVVKSRRSLGLAEADMGLKVTTIAAQETHPGLANAYRKIGKVIQATGDYHAAQGTAEATTLGDPLTYHSFDAFIVKETLTNRQILIRELIQAQATTRSKLSSADRLKASSRVGRDKADEAISALEEARSHETHLTAKTQRVTANLVLERRKWFARTAADLRSAIREYVVREIEHERRTLATLEQVRPDIRAIDSSGGLSRLGRESHPTVRRTSLASSQGPKGDAWSGVPRRPDGLNRSITGAFGQPTLPEEEEGSGAGAGAGTSETGSAAAQNKQGSTAQDEDDDRIDAKNAASRLATTTF